MDDIERGFKAFASGSFSLTNCNLTSIACWGNYVFGRNIGEAAGTVTDYAINITGNAYFDGNNTINGDARATNFWVDGNNSSFNGTVVATQAITVNGNVVNIASYQVKAGDVVAIREKSKSLEVIADSLASKSSYEWLQFNDEKKEGTFISAPERIQIPEDIKEQLIVELYSK